MMHLSWVQPTLALAGDRHSWPKKVDETPAIQLGQGHAWDRESDREGERQRKIHQESRAKRTNNKKKICWRRGWGAASCCCNIDDSCIMVQWCCMIVLVVLLSVGLEARGWWWLWWLCCWWTDCLRDTTADRDCRVFHVVHVLHWECMSWAAMSLCRAHVARKQVFAAGFISSVLCFCLKHIISCCTNFLLYIFGK